MIHFSGFFLDIARPRDETSGLGKHKKKKEMGKASKRREGKERVRPQPMRSVPTTPSLLEKPNPPFPVKIAKWETHQQALKQLVEDGWEYAPYVTSYSSTELCDRVTLLLQGTGIHAVDCTNQIPTGPNANLSSYPLVLTTLEEVSKVSDDKIYFLLRTRENTPAFLGGTTYLFTLEMGSHETAVAFTKGFETPVLVALFRGVHITLPTTAAQGSCLIPAKIIAAMIGDDSFECAICQQSLLVKHSNDEYELKTFLGTNCDHAFHTECMFDHLKTGRSGCPTCRCPLPFSWVPEGERPTSQSDDSFRQPRPIGFLDADEAEIMQMNALHLR